MSFRNGLGSCLWGLVGVLAGILAAPGATSAGSFSSAGEALGVDLVKHPLVYDGTGGALTLDVCLDPASPDAAAAAATVRFAVATWNARQVASPNLSTDAGVGPGELDFESAALRGLGLCLGLDDPSDAEGFTAAANGDNNFFQRDDGPDDVPGTRDDLRGDDLNLMWFRFIDNDPFTVSATVDRSSYTRDTAILPEGDTYAATPTRAVAAALGEGASEAVMVASLAPGEAKRRLAADDIATRRYAETGLDEIAGTSDDYTVELVWAGLADDCDLVLSFDVQAEPAACFGPAQQIDAQVPNHYRFAFATLTFSDAVVWHFSGEGLIFADGFESGDVGAWSASLP